MDPEIAQFIKENPERANALADKWQTFINIYARENPEILSINSREEFFRWAAQHPEKNIDTSIWFGKKIIESYSLQEDKNKAAADETQSQEKRGREQGPSISARDINRIIKSAEQPQATTPQPTYQPKPPTPTRGGIGRRFGLPGRRVASGIGRLGTRLVTQAGMAAGRAVAGALVSNPIGWIVIAVIIVIIIIVFLIIMLAGGGGGQGGQALVPGRLYECSPDVNDGIPFDFATSTANCSSGPPVECFNPALGCAVDLAPDGNTCASWSAICHGIAEGQTLTGACNDKCTDLPLTKICSPDVNNNCPDPNLACQGQEGTPVSGAGSKTFCIEYTVSTPTPTPI